MDVDSARVMLGPVECAIATKTNEEVTCNLVGAAVSGEWKPILTSSKGNVKV